MLRGEILGLFIEPMTEQQLNIRIGEKVASLRTKKNLTQKELANLIDSEYQNISRLERGLVNPGAYFLYKIAVALETTLSDLLQFEE